MWSITRASVFSIFTSALLSAFFRSSRRTVALFFGHRPWDPADFWFLACTGGVKGEGKGRVIFSYQHNIMKPNTACYITVGVVNKMQCWKVRCINYKLDVHVY